MKKPSQVFVFLLGILFISALVFSYYLYNRFIDLQIKYNLLKDNPQKVAQEEIKATVNRVSELIILPENEEPTIATVAEPEKLKDQPFFAKAQIGFKVLIYTKAKKAILYDPQNHKIVEVAPVNIGDPAEKPKPEEDPKAK